MGDFLGVVFLRMPLGHRVARLTSEMDQQPPAAQYPRVQAGLTSFPSYPPAISTVHMQDSTSQVWSYT